MGLSRKVNINNATSSYLGKLEDGQYPKSQRQWGFNDPWV